MLAQEGRDLQLVLGGLLSLLTACRRPELVEGLLMLDSPVVSGWRAHSVRMVKAMGLIARVSPGKISRQRRHRWPDRAAVQAHFESKHKFARWDPRVLADYVDCGFAPGPDGQWHLRFTREVETRIYNTLPHHLDALLRRAGLRWHREEGRAAHARPPGGLARAHGRRSIRTYPPPDLRDSRLAWDRPSYPQSVAGISSMTT